MVRLCVVFLCDKAYFNKFVNTCTQLITTGNYKGDICLVIGNDLHNHEMLDCDIIKNNNITIKHFPNITFTKEFLEINNTLNTTDGRNITKKFQWHKLHLFNAFFKNWEYIFYLDCGLTIFSDISPIINEVQERALLAHSDAYPVYEWRLHVQFDKNNDVFTKLNNTYDLNVDYFQTTMMLYDTSIIKENTFNDLYNLTLEYPISRNNEQGIIALYFTNIEPCFKQIRTRNENIYFYDYLKREPTKEYIMLKMC